VSAGPDPKIDISMIEQARKQINRLADEVAHLSEQDLAPADYYGEFLQRVITAIAAPAGAVWIRTAQGNLQLQYQINLREVGLDRSEEARKTHDELLRQAILKGQPGFFPPQSGLGPAQGDGPAAGNPTDHVILLAPILVEKQVAGIVEIWQDPNRGPEAQRGFLHFLVRMAGHAGSYTRNHQLRTMTGQQQVWTQLESFARQVHGSLNPTEVSYMVANEGRRLVECDRVSVAIRRGRYTTVEAISGADVVEKRSNLVQLMRTLFDNVLIWGEKLTYKGEKDDSLPPDVLKALDEYLAESNSKTLAILPLQDEREKDNKRPPRSALMMECFDPSSTPEQLIARLEVVGRHSVAALYNAAEHRRIPMRFIWAPIARVQEGLGGKARAIMAGIGAALAILIAVLVLVPGTLKVEAKGKLMPKKRQFVFAQMEGRIRSFKAGVAPGSYVSKGKDLIEMFDENLASKIASFQAEIISWDRKYQNAKADILKLKSRPNVNPAEINNLIRDQVEAETQKLAKMADLRAYQREKNADPNNPGVFWVKSPLSGTILTSDYQGSGYDFREFLTNRHVKQNEPLMRVGYAGPRIGDWEIELRIPQKNIGQILAAYPADNPKAELDVDVLLLSAPTRTFKGKLARYKIYPEASPSRDDNNETEPVVLAVVRIDGDDIPEGDRLPTELLLTDTEVHAKVRCGKHALGYTLFYGVWEWMYEKIIFGWF
jgi:hypothetical protein